MPTREDRTQLGALSKRAGGWGEVPDRQYQCPSCDKTCCGAALNERQVESSKANGHRKRCPELACHRAAGWGTSHSGFGRCKFHFGASQSNTRAAARQQARTLMRTYGVPVEIDPEDALREEIHRTVGHVRWLAEKVSSLGDDEITDEGPIGDGGPRAARVIDVKAMRSPNQDADDEDTDYDEDVTKDLQRITPTGDEALVFGVSERELQAGGPGGGFDRVKVSAAPNVWLQIYMAERKHLADVTKIAMQAGLESRRLDWAEGMADRLLVAFEELASALGQDPNDPAVRLATVTALERITARSA